MRSTLKYVLVLVLILVAVAVVARRRGPQRLLVEVGAATRQATFTSSVTASGEIVANRYADIGSDAMGKIVSLPVAEGDRVRVGQILARIDPVQAESDVLGVTAQVGALEAEERSASDQVRLLRAEVEAASARARDADQQFRRKRDLSEQGLIPTTEFETGKASNDAAIAQLQSARAAVDRALQAQDAAARRVGQARAQQVRVNDVFKKTSIRSPIDGIVTRLRVREGEMVVIGLQNQPGTTLMTVSDLAVVNAEVKVAEADVLRIEVGQRAEVSLEAIPRRRFGGRVAEVGASALPVIGTGAAAREFRVVVRLDAPDPGLRPGLTCDAEIVTSERANALTVPLQAVVLRPGPAGSPDVTGVFTVSDDVVTFVPVTQGPIGGVDVEVSGIDERARVVVGPFQALRELQHGTMVRVAPSNRGS